MYSTHGRHYGGFVLPEWQCQDPGFDVSGEPGLVYSGGPGPDPPTGDGPPSSRSPVWFTAAVPVQIHRPEMVRRPPGARSGLQRQPRSRSTGRRWPAVLPESGLVYSGGPGPDSRPTGRRWPAVLPEPGLVYSGVPVQTHRPEMARRPLRSPVWFTAAVPVQTPDPPAGDPPSRAVCRPRANDFWSPTPGRGGGAGSEGRTWHEGVRLQYRVKLDLEIQAEKIAIFLMEMCQWLR